MGLTGRGRAAAWVATSVALVAGYVVLVNQLNVEPTSVAAAPGESTSTSISTPPPSEVIFGRTIDATTGRAEALRIGPSGVVAAAHPTARTDQVRGTRQVFSKVLDATSSPFSGCGIAGCSSGYNTTTEAGIAMAALDGTDVVQLTKGGYDTEPAFGRDGTIAFIRHQRVAGTAYDVTNAIARMTTNGKIIQRLVPPIGHSYDSFAWSPDGTHIAVLRTSRGQPADVPGAANVFVISLEDQSARHIAAGNFRQLAWSHDGTRLAATRMAYQRYGNRPYEPGDHHTGDDLWILPLDGAAPSQVTRVAPKSEMSAVFCGGSGASILFLKTPIWSPDDSRIAMLSNHNRLASMGRTFDVVVASLDGTVTTLYQPPADSCVRTDAYNQHQRENERLTLYGWL